MTNILSLLKESDSPHKFVVLTPDKIQYGKYASANVRIIDIPDACKHNILFPVLYHVILPRLLREHRIDLIFNLGDIPIPSPKPQLYIFDWSYAVYPESIVWKRLDLGGYLSRKIKLFWFKRYLKHASIVIAQTAVMKHRLESIFGLDNVEVVPNAVSLENHNGGMPVDFRLPHGKFNLLCLSHYYSHKNIEIFIPVALKIKQLSLPYCIITTIDRNQHKGASAFLDDIMKHGLEDVIINIGSVEMASVPSLYSQCDAVLLPTLLESFSGTYVEAMFHCKPILTSKMDFAEDVCGSAAFYFDPMDSDSILESVRQARDDIELREKRVENGKAMVRNMPTWNQAFERYQELFEMDARK